MTRRKGVFHHLRGSEEGSALIEFATSTSILLAVIFGIVDCSRALYADHFVCDAATQAARYAMVRGSTWSGTSCASTSAAACMATAGNVTSYVQGTAPIGVSGSSTYLTVNTTWPGTTPAGASCSSSGVYNSPGCIVRVNVRYTYSFILPFLPKNSLILTSTAVYAISQ